jgi:hypothetical protein
MRDTAEAAPGREVRTKAGMSWPPVWFSAAMILCVFNESTGALPAYPLAASGNGRYLVDADGAPFLVIGDAPHSLLVNTTTDEAAVYLKNRADYGINTLWVELLCTSYVNGRPDGSMLDGTLPFTNRLATGAYDLTTPNETYFVQVDTVLRIAATNGIQVLLDSLETGDWTSVALENGTERCREYGQYLGARYSSFTNLIWITGNDFQSWTTPTNDAVVLAVALGIRDRDTNHLQTTELNYSVSQSLDDPNWWSILGINSVYTYYPTYAETLLAYNEPNFLPALFLEEHYEYEEIGGEMGTPNVLRRQEYWALLSGAAAGYMGGNYWTWTFNGGWQGYLNSPGVQQLLYAKQFFGQRRWYDLIPDENHTLLTSGYGTFSEGGNVSDSDYATAAETADGTLAVCYMPTARTIAVDLAQMASNVVARWFDPAGNLYVPISGSPLTNSGSFEFTSPGTNSDGDDDWVLVLETHIPPLEGLPAVRITAPVSGSTESGAVTLSASVEAGIGIAGVQFRVDGADMGGPVPSAPYEVVWNSLGWGNGLHTVQAEAWDLAGNAAADTVDIVLSNAPLDSFLVAAYPFDEGTGAVAGDASAHGNDGVVSDAAWTGAGKYGEGLAFGGSGWVTATESSSLDLSNGMTLAGWVFPTNWPGTWTTVVMKETTNSLAYMLQMDPSGVPNVYVQTTNGLQGVAAPSAIPLGAWTHLAGTYDGAVVRVYVNGILSGSAPASGDIIRSMQPLRMGGDAVWGEYFQGVLDEVRIYRRALSDGGIVACMNTAIASGRRPSLSAPAQTAQEIAQGGFRLLVSAEAPVYVVVQRSSDLEAWQSAGSLACSNGTTEFRDTATSGAGCFYRVIEP